MAEWHFPKVRENDSNRDPIQGEFFVNESISEPGDALVREGIQNSLDASKDGQKIGVRIYLSGTEMAVPAEQVSRYLTTARHHHEAKKNGLSGIPEADEACSFLVFEDVGTKGLSGDPTQFLPMEEGQRNDFYHFFRAEGQTQDASGRRGRWGVGKYVFPQASRINTILGLTSRADDERKLLMGKSVLKTHFVDGECFRPDGWYGLQDTEDSLVLPIEDENELAHFQSVFRLSRHQGHGLSIVVPHCVKELSYNGLLKSVICHYSFAILQNKLDVKIEAPGKDTLINSDSLDDLLEKLKGDLKPTVAPMVRLQRWAVDNPEPANVLSMPERPTEIGPKWADELISETTGNELRSALDEFRPVAVRVPITVRKPDADPRASFFDIFLEHCNDHLRPAVIRQGINIADVRSSQVTEIRSLIVVEDEPLADMIGDAENPSHTRLEIGEHLKQRYLAPGTVLTYIKQSVRNILRTLNAADSEPDRQILADFFPLNPNSDDGRPDPPPDRPPGPRPPPDPSPLETNPQAYAIDSIRGGFTVRSTGGDSIPPFLHIQVGFDTRNGNPIRQWQALDFELDQHPIEISNMLGLEVVQRGGNTLVARTLESSFSLQLTGFDPLRDLYIKVVPLESFDGDS